MINSARNGIAEAIRDRTEFAKFDPQSASTTARILVRLGIDSSELRETQEGQRDHFIADA